MTQELMTTEAIDAQKPKLPPGPKSAVWQTIRYAREPEEAVLDLGRRWGELFTTPTLAGPLVVAGAPETVRAIFSADPDTFEPFAVASMSPILGEHSMLLQHGAPHKRARRLMQPPFHGARMRAYGTRIVEVTRERLAAAPRDRPFPIERLFREISIAVICRTVFGAEAGERTERFREQTIQALSSFNPLVVMFPFLRRNFGGFGPWAKFQRSLGALHEMLRAEIRVRKERRVGEDILSLLVAARDEDGSAMEEQEIVEQLFTLVIAGYETTATILAWAVNELWLHRAVLDRLKQELSSTEGDPDRLAQHPFLEAVCTETLRRHPLAPMVSRRLLKPFALGGYQLPVGTGVGACLLLTQRNPHAYPEPEAFRPERFEGAAKVSPHEYFPFGGGARRCLGAAFALHEMKIVLGTIVREANLALVAEKRARPEARQATVGPKGGVAVLLRAT